MMKLDHGDNNPQLMSVGGAAWLSGLEPADVRWLASRGLFPRPLQLRGKNNRLVLAFYRAEIEDWVQQKRRERDAATVPEEDGEPSALLPASLYNSASAA
jgi:predicted DNA-binding transcriptional regulator AlpA